VPATVDQLRLGHRHRPRRCRRPRLSRPNDLQQSIL
jgi:hypothetical protein